MYRGVSALLVLSVFVGLLGLACWQLTRGLDKQARAQLGESDMLYRSADALNFAQHDVLKGDLTLNLAPRQQDTLWLIDNQLRQQRLGVDFMQLAQIASSSDYIFVRLGWLPLSAQRLPQGFFTRPQKTWQVSGWLVKPKQNLFIQNKVEMRQGWRLLGQLDLDNTKVPTGGRLLPYVFYPDSADEGLQMRQYQPNNMTPERHFGYALQWLLLAVVWLVLSLKVMQKRGTYAQ